MKVTLLFQRICIAFFLAAVCAAFINAYALTSKPKIRLPNLSVVNFEPRKVSSGAPLLILHADLEQGLHLNKEAPSKYVLSVEEPGKENFFEQHGISSPREEIVISIEREATVTLDALFYYCPEEQKTVCYMKSYTFIVPVVIDKEAGTSEPINLTARLARQDGPQTSQVP